jgi:hypothetical protein
LLLGLLIGEFPAAVMPRFDEPVFVTNGSDAGDSVAINRIGLGGRSFRNRRTLGGGALRCRQLKRDK